MNSPVRSSRILGSKKVRSSKVVNELSFIQEDASTTSHDSAIIRLSKIDLTKFCPKVIFYIFFVAENDTKSSTLLENLFDIGKNYEKVSSVTFITRAEVLSLLDCGKQCVFPNQLKPLLLDVIENAKASNQLSSLYEAQLIKLKLIQIMYEQYVSQVKRNQRERNLEELLNSLTRECRKKQKKEETGQDTNSPEKTKIPSKEETKKKNRKEEKITKEGHTEEDLDYTSIPLENDEIIFEKNVFNYIWFYCIKGFYNIDTYQLFTQQLRSPLSAIVRISDKIQYDVEVAEYISTFWNDIEAQFFKNTSSFKNMRDTMLMNFSPTKTFSKENSLELLQEFVFALRRIVDIRISHLNYIRHLKPNKVRNSYNIMPTDCMSTYIRSLRHYPLEYIDSTMVLDSLLKETCSRLNSSASSTTKSLSLSNRSSRTMHTLECMDPLKDLDYFYRSKKLDEKYTKQDAKGFLVHDNNDLLNILMSNKNVGARVYDISLSLMKKIPIFENVLMQRQMDSRDIPHLHDVDPSNKLEFSDDEMLNNFMFLFLFNTFSLSSEVSEPLKEHNLTRNLITFDLHQYWQNAQASVMDAFEENDVNLYDISLVHFRWKEKLTSDVLVQEVFKAVTYFSYADQKYSPETDDFLVVLSDKLDHFGLNTKIFETVVRTPVCLRDFCRYVSVEETDWLKKHECKIFDEDTFKIQPYESCTGVHKVKTTMKMFQEYSYLLDDKIKDIDDNTNEIISEEEFPSAGDEVKSLNVDFKQVLTDLKNYPYHNGIPQECETASDQQMLLSYDLGTDLCKVTGHITTFCSHDGVKVTVDSTRFLQNPEKCTINIISEGNSVTLHSNESLLKHSYITSLILIDGSRISLVVNKPESKICEKNSALDDFVEEREEEVKNIFYETQEAQNQAEFQEQTGKRFVHCVSEENFKKLVGMNQSLENISPVEDYGEFLEYIKNAIDDNGTIYKINKKLTFLQRVDDDLRVPLDQALKNVIPNDDLPFSDFKTFETYTKRFESIADNKSELETKCSVDFRLCLPNGLFIRAHPCAVDEKNLMIKQEFVEDKPKRSTIQHEEFRLFSYLGFILVKIVDGTITILKANGDMIDFEKPNDGSGSGSNVKPCHCSTLDDYRNKINRMLEKELYSDFSASRRGHISDKHNHIFDQKLLKLLESFDIPYIKKSITRFDGKKIKIQGNKITQKQMYHITSQQDFFTEEIFFERNDNFRSTVERNGSQKILFPDGTLISTCVDIADELVDDFVYVMLSFQYEHPNYATVTYDFDKTLNIVLKNDVVLKKSFDDERFTVNIKERIEVSVTKKEVTFKKICDECSGEFYGQLNIEPFFENIWSPNKKFLQVCDSYGKKFFSDFVGNCSRSSDYIKGRLNSLNCNHFKKNTYTKMFIIYRDLSGFTFLTNDMVKDTKTELERSEDGSVSTYNTISNKNILVVDCRRKMYTSYCDRYTNTSILEQFRYFDKPTHQKQEVYVTFRVFHEMFQSVEDIERHILNMQQVYFSEMLEYIDGKEIIFKNIAKLKSDLEFYYEVYKQEMLDEQEKINRKIKKADKKEMQQRKCDCLKKKLTVADKINNWKQACALYKKVIKDNKIPNYFLSEFCRIKD